MIMRFLTLRYKIGLPIRVRQQQWDGCMADVLTRERYGSIVREGPHDIYDGQMTSYHCYWIKWDDTPELKPQIIPKLGFRKIDGILTERI